MANHVEAASNNFLLPNATFFAELLAFLIILGVIWRYIVRNSLATSVQMIAQNVQYLLGGIILVEVVFAYPGIGSLLVNAVTARDFTEVQAITMIVGACYVATNIVADLPVVFLVPKLRTTELA